MNWRVTGISAVALLVMGGSSLQAALIGYWPFNEGSGTDTDNVVGPIDATFVNLTSGAWSTGPGNVAPVAGNTASIEFGNAANGSTGYVDLGNIGVSGDATVSMWIKADSVFGDKRLYSQVGSANATLPGAASMDSLGGGAVAVWDGGNWKDVSGYGPVPEGSWHHLAFVFNAGSVAFYVDGDLEGTNTSAFDFNGNDRRMAIGARYLDTYGFPFDGRIDDVSVWNEALSEAQVDLLAAGASPLSLVPEPASLALLAVGGLALLRRRA